MGFLIKIYILLGSYKGTLNLSLGNFHLYRLLMAVKKDTKEKKNIFRRLRELIQNYLMKILTTTSNHSRVQTSTWIYAESSRTCRTAKLCFCHKITVLSHFIQSATCQQGLWCHVSHLGTREKSSYGRVWGLRTQRSVIYIILLLMNFCCCLSRRLRHFSLLFSFGNTFVGSNGYSSSNIYSRLVIHRSDWCYWRKKSY